VTNTELALLGDTAATDIAIALYELDLKPDGILRAFEEGAWGEVRRRLEDPKLVRSIPPHILFKFATDLMRVDLALQERTAPEAKARTQNVLALIFDSGLPLDRRRELLTQAIEQLKAVGEDVSAHEQALKELEAGNGSG
jgi:hypothetical protein